MIEKEKIKKDLLEYLIGVNGDKNITENDMIGKYGLDSLDIVEMEFALEKKYFVDNYSRSSGISSCNTVDEAVEKLYVFLNKEKEKKQESDRPLWS